VPEVETAAATHYVRPFQASSGRATHIARQCRRLQGTYGGQNLLRQRKSSGNTYNEKRARLYRTIEPQTQGASSYNLAGMRCQLRIARKPLREKPAEA
jgi:hypothetical protein